jgi:predicted nucleic acid-binding protein
MAEPLYVIDSFAWFEYFLGSEAEMRANPYIEAGNAITPTIVIAELSHKYAREKMSFSERLNFILARTQDVNLDTAIARQSGLLNHKRKQVTKRLGLADSIELATARTHSAKIITGDEHFRDLTDEVIMIK